MFNINKDDLAYEKLMRSLNEEGLVPNPNDPMDLNNNIGDPSMDAVNAAQNGIDPQQAYEMALKAMDDKIELTGRSRYQKYRMGGGKASYTEFKDQMEEKALKQIDKEMKEQFGFVPGKETEKDLLFQIRDLLKGLKQNNDEEQQLTAMQMTGGQPDQAPPPQPDPNQMQGGQPPMEQDSNAMQQDQAPPQPDPNQMQGGQPPMEQGQQPMQESYDSYEEMKYNKRMKELFNYYFN